MPRQLRPPSRRKRQSKSVITQPGYHKGRESPTKGQKFPAEALTPEEIEAFEATISSPAMTPTRSLAIFTLMYRVGLRVSQVIALERRHYTAGTNKLTIPAWGREPEHTVHIDDVTRDRLDRWSAIRKDQLHAPPTWPLFCTVNKDSRGFPMSPAAIREMLRRHARTANIDKRIDPRGLRKTYFERQSLRSPIALHFEQYLDEESLRRRYPVAYETWQSAMDLAQVDATRHATMIGHLSRETLNAFARELCQRLDVKVEDGATANARIKAAVAARIGIGKSMRELVDGLLKYWNAINGLTHRQEHGAKREKEALSAEDGSRLLFHAMTVMHEVDRAVEWSTERNRLAAAA
jgi:integrase